MKATETKLKRTPVKEEEQLYEPVKNALQREFFQKLGSKYYGGKVYLEITAKGQFSEDLKEVLDDKALSILRVERFSPDITGFMPKKDSSSKELVTVEIKPDKIKIKHISRAKLYADVLNATYGILISPKRIPEEIRRFILDRYAIRNRQYGSFIIAQYDKATNEFKFDKKLYRTVPEPFST